MAIFRCNKCGHLQEAGKEYVGKSVKCPKCETTATIHDTVPFVRALVKKYFTLRNELQTLNNQNDQEVPENSASDRISLGDIDINNTDILTKPECYQPVITWFDKRGIKANVSQETVDTTGFFDEIAILLGDHFSDLSFVSNQIKYIQSKGYDTVKIELAKKSDQEIEQIISFCRQLYDYSFVAKWFHKKQDKTVYLTLQSAPRIKEFFNGIWMEWYVLMKLLALFRERNSIPACARSLQISHSGGTLNEIDIFLLTEAGTPIAIECKSGEFRQDIGKCLSLRKLLGLASGQFIVCVFGLADEHARGMTSMYDVTFVNERSLIDHVKTAI
jgi:hypothetical protein